MIDIIDYAVEDEKDAEDLRAGWTEKVRKELHKNTMEDTEGKKGDRRKYITISDRSRVPRMWK